MLAMGALQCWDIVYSLRLSKRIIWRRTCRGGLPVACTIQLARRGHVPPHLAPSFSRSSIYCCEAVYRIDIEFMEQINTIPLGSGFQRLSVADLEIQQHEEEPCELRVMEGVRKAIATLSQITSEVKVYLIRTYSTVCSIADQNKEQNLEFKYVHSRLSCVDSRLDDIERNTVEILGKMDSIREDLSVFISKTQFSQVHEAPSVNQGMMEAASFLQQTKR